MIQAGKLRFFIDIEQPVVTGRGDRGQPVISWVVLYSGIPVDIHQFFGREVEQARALVATATHKLTLRWLTGLNETMRAVYQRRYFNFGYVDDGDFKRVVLYITCTEQKTGAS